MICPRTRSKGKEKDPVLAGAGPLNSRLSEGELTSALDNPDRELRFFFPKGTSTDAPMSMEERLMLDGLEFLLDTRSSLADGFAQRSKLKSEIPT
jgi:hypothetical protein